MVNKPSRELGPLANVLSAQPAGSASAAIRPSGSAETGEEDQLVPEPDNGVKIDEKMLDEADRKELEELRQMRDKYRHSDAELEPGPLNALKQVRSQDQEERALKERELNIKDACREFVKIVHDIPGTAPASHTLFGRAVGTINVGQAKFIAEVLERFISA